MTIEIGKHARQGSKPNGPVGKLVRVEDGQATLEGHTRFRETPTFTAPADDLVQVCGRVMWGGYDSRLCGRPVKEGDLCGIHAGAEKRVRNNLAKATAEAKANEERRKREAQRRNEADAELRAAGVEYDYLTTAGGVVKVTLTLDQVRALVAR